MSNIDVFKYLAITKNWLEQAECFNEDGSINVEKLNSLTKGHKYIIDEATFFTNDKLLNELKKSVQIRKRLFSQNDN
ncbi:hypothetical protein BK784_21140 [Bacillus thuringiensis serovar medellin]|uniref:Uncharacterized protein n=1 Tax=Bacillus thuringiensis subsp. medellin TaxID=79672 RepID=A0A9X6RDW1_BACTV|nr:hypothetical protein [Bacillus thuringiensis]OUB94125.1 hypothetical protein BK784_21140 [Bacillus thuringiensis serovar medellin]